MKITLLLFALTFSFWASAQKKKQVDPTLKLRYAAALLEHNTTQDSSKIEFYLNVEEYGKTILTLRNRLTITIR